MTEILHPADLSPLYEAVQSAGIFPDSKYFVDCTLRSSPEMVVAAYQREKEAPGFDLSTFVATHFQAPADTQTDYSSARRPLREHLEALWEVLTRHSDAVEVPGYSSLLPLPYPYIVPGGRFREVYYWDSYFTMLGLKVSGRNDLIRSMADNFADLIDRFGRIPNGNRSYYLGRSQPPFFAMMVRLLADLEGEETLLRYQHQLEKEYAFWMSGENDLSPGVAQGRVVCVGEGELLNRYWDDLPLPRPEAYSEDVELAHASGRPAEEVYRHVRAAAESGWDFSSRWFAAADEMTTIQTTDLLPVDLNCLLYFLEKTLVDTYRLRPDRVPVEVFKERARKRKNAIQNYFWAEDAGFYFDYNLVTGQRSEAWTLAGVAPLFFQVATPEQAAQVARHIEEKFLHPGGLTASLNITGQQWDAPNGWAPLQWMTFQGLMHYGHIDLAEKIRRNWMSLNEKTYQATGKMMEKYNVMDVQLEAGGGEYPNQDGFGWTNGVYLAMAAYV